MSTNFNIPQRQSAIGVILMLTDTIVEVIKNAWFIIVLFVLRSPSQDILKVSLGAFVIFILLIVFAYLKYKNFTFYIDDQNDEFIINHGVLNKSKTVIQLNKLQQVNITQSFLQKIIGVYGIEVDTAGSENKEAKIKAISHSLAQDLREKLLQSKELSKETNNFENQVEETVFTTQENQFLKLSLLSLIKIGITSNYVKSIGLILTFFFTIYENLQQIGKDDLINESNIESVANATPLYVLIILILIVMISINLVRTIIKFYDFKIIKQSKSLLLSYGLLNTKSTLLKPSRVQIISISSNYFQKKLNVLEIKIKQAIADNDKEKKSIIEIPGCNQLEKNKILELILKEMPVHQIQLKSNFRKLVFSIFTTIVIPVLLFFVINHFAQKFQNYYFLLVVYTLFFMILIYFGFYNYKLYLSQNYVVKQSGAWDIENEIIAVDKIQALSTSQLFWHKKLNIGTLHIHTAAGTVNFQLTNYEIVKQYVNLWLYKIETSNANWM